MSKSAALTLQVPPQQQLIVSEKCHFVNQRKRLRLAARIGVTRECVLATIARPNNAPPEICQWSRQSDIVDVQRSADTKEAHALRFTVRMPSSKTKKVKEKKVEFAFASAHVLLRVLEELKPPELRRQQREPTADVTQVLAQGAVQMTSAAIQAHANEEAQRQERRRQRLLSSDEEVRRLFERLVGGRVVSADAFWEKHDPRSTRAQSTSVPNEIPRVRNVEELLDMLQSGSGSGSGSVRSGQAALTPALIRAIFLRFPAVQLAYRDTVPALLTKQQFWQRFVSARYLQRHANRQAETLDPFWRKYDAAATQQKRLMQQRLLKREAIPHRLDLSCADAVFPGQGMSADMHSLEVLERSRTAQAKQAKERAALLRHMNRESILVAAKDTSGSARMPPSQEDRPSSLSEQGGRTELPLPLCDVRLLFAGAHATTSAQEVEAKAAAAALVSKSLADFAARLAAVPASQRAVAVSLPMLQSPNESNQALMQMLALLRLQRRSELQSAAGVTSVAQATSAEEQDDRQGKSTGAAIIDTLLHEGSVRQRVADDEGPERKRRRLAVHAPDGSEYEIAAEAEEAVRKHARIVHELCSHFWKLFPFRKAHKARLQRLLAALRGEHDAIQQQRVHMQTHVSTRVRATTPFLNRLLVPLEACFVKAQHTLDKLAEHERRRREAKQARLSDQLTASSGVYSSSSSSADQSASPEMEDAPPPLEPAPAL